MTADPRERIRTAAQRGYWDALSAEYARITRIRTDDFHYGPQIPGESSLRLLPPLGPGASALELGCGEGQNSVWLAKKGVRCEALDVSEGQLAFARALAAREGISVAFRRASLEDFAAAPPPPPEGRFDLVHSSHALEFVQDPAAVVRAMAAAAKDGGGRCRLDRPPALQRRVDRGRMGVRVRRRRGRGRRGALSARLLRAPGRRARRRLRPRRLARMAGLGVVRVVPRRGARGDGAAGTARGARRALHERRLGRARRAARPHPLDRHPRRHPPGARRHSWRCMSQSRQGACNSFPSLLDSAPFFTTKMVVIQGKETRP